MPVAASAGEQDSGAIGSGETAASGSVASSVEPTTESARKDKSRRARRQAKPESDASAELAHDPAPEDAVRSLERALAAMREENWIEAELVLEQLVLEHPGYPGPYVNLAIVYRQDGRQEDARAALEQALALDPSHAAANNELGIVLRGDGRFDAAEQAYLRALETDPAYALAHYNLGVLLDLYARRPAEALQHYEQYQSMVAEPNELVARWIVDLRRRLGVTDDARVADGS